MSLYCNVFMRGMAEQTAERHLPDGWAQLKPTGADCCQTRLTATTPLKRKKTQAPGGTWVCLENKLTPERQVIGY